jgi:lysophospholipase L1-like esterase
VDEKRNTTPFFKALGFKIFSCVTCRLWNAQIRAFESKDRANRPAPGGIVFVGSSTFAFWDTLELDMEPLPVIRRGFGGSTIRDVIHYTPRIVLPYEPRMVILYAGDNDIWFKHQHGVDAHAAEECLADVQAFVRIVHDAIPDASIYFVSIKPSPSRWGIWPLMARANTLVKEIMASDPRLHYIDTTPVMFDDQGRVRDDLFKKDMLHLNAKGYALWTSVIKPLISAGHGTGLAVKDRAASGML